MQKNNISIVIPAYNEEGSIRKTIKRVYEFLSNNFNDFEIIVVDDGSIDSTQFACQEMARELGSRLVVLRHIQNRGYGAALRTGLFSAKKELVFYTDADNQFDIKELPGFLKEIEYYDMVIGFRMNRQDRLIRKFCAYVYNRIVYLLFGLDVKDIDCSFKLFKKEPLKLLTIDTDEFLVDTELLVKAKIKNFKIKQIGVTHYPRSAGKSTVKIKHVFSTIRDLKFLYNKLRAK